MIMHVVHTHNIILQLLQLVKVLENDKEEKHNYLKSGIGKGRGFFYTTSLVPSVGCSLQIAQCDFRFVSLPTRP